MATTLVGYSYYLRGEWDDSNINAFYIFSTISVGVSSISSSFTALCKLNGKISQNSKSLL